MRRDTDSSESATQRLARRQLADYDARSPGRMFCERDRVLTVEEAYRLQFEIARLRQQRGEAIAGYKIGCVSRTIQRQLGIDRPVFGHVFASEIRLNHAVLSKHAFCNLGIEGEIAVMIGDDIPSLESLRDRPHRFVQQVFPVIELHNYVFRGPTSSAGELIANNALHAGVVMPEARAAVDGDQALEIRLWIGAEEKGAAHWNPFTTLVELAELLSEFGVRLRRGDIVLAGSPLPLYTVNPGDSIRAFFPSASEVAATVEP